MSCRTKSASGGNKSGTQRSRAWCFTINNYTPEEVSRLESVKCVRMVVGVEQGESGTPHLQGYCRFPEHQRFSWWKNQFPRAHVEVRRGNEEEAVNYCRKDGHVIIDYGDTEVVHDRKLSREDTTLDVIERLSRGDTVHSIFKAHPVFYFYNRRNILSIRDDIIRWDMNTDYVPNASV